MGRRPERAKKIGFFLGLVKLGMLMGMVFGISYGTAILYESASDYTLADIYTKTLPYSGLAADYFKKIEKVPEVASYKDSRSGEVNESAAKDTKVPVVKICLLGDSHDNNQNLAKALRVCESEAVDFVIFLGDYTAVGDLDALKLAKKTMDASGLEYYSLPGDHDLATSGDSEHYTEVFGIPNLSKSYKGFSFVLFDNSPNYTGLNQDAVDWFKSELGGSNVFVFVSNPLYHSSNFRVMGQDSTVLAKQRDELLIALRASHVSLVVAGDHHAPSRSKDPTKSSLMHYVNGALLNETSYPEPMFATLNIFEDGSYEIREILLSARSE